MFISTTRLTLHITDIVIRGVLSRLKKVGRSSSPTHTCFPTCAAWIHTAWLTSVDQVISSSLCQSCRVMPEDSFESEATRVHTHLYSRHKRMHASTRAPTDMHAQTKQIHVSALIKHLLMVAL